jgi:hypothetical protein
MLQRSFISTAILLGIQTLVAPSLLLPASPAVSVTPVLLASGQVELTSTLSMPGTAAVTWTLNPQVGAVSPGGVYTAPATITSVQTVVVTATSISDVTQSGSLAITLRPTVTVSVSPAQTSLQALQSQQFSVALQGATDPTVIWSVNPSVGTISASGVYTAPSAVSSPQTVTVTATSAANPDSSASGVVALVLAVTIGINPQTVQLTVSQSQQFNVTIANTTNPTVTWSLVPPVGTLANGLYTAPSGISIQQTVTLTAISAADPTKSASAIISLVPPVVIGIAPTSVSLTGGQSTQFSLSISGTTNTAAVWSLSPPVGTAANGLYTAPATVNAPQTILLTVTSSADPTKTAQASITLTPPTPITLPIEVPGPGGPQVSVSFNVPSGSNLGGQLNLWLQIHGLHFQTEASVQINGGTWIPINSSTVTLLGQANAYGGIGGGFNTLQMTMPVPLNSLQQGSNTITFQFNGTDGRVSEFRVLGFNIQNSSGESLIPSTTFLQEDPGTWQPPSTSASDVAAGEQLFRQAPLTVPTSSGNAPILARCTNCHTQDGRDIKYFNYSNNSIQTRAMFHGLSAQQGDQIATYIRSLNVPSPGRPWNPPYQPGPGLDSNPVTDWAAGAGIDAVLDQDIDTLASLAPGGSTAGWSASSNVSAREIPIALQLADWNSWLPGIHPMDAFPDFQASKFNADYSTLRAMLVPGDAAAYAASTQAFANWHGDEVAFRTPKMLAATDPGWTPTYVNGLYSERQWMLVKDWELNQEFQLEGMGQVVHGPQGDPRAWYYGLAFGVSPNMLHIPKGAAGVHNGSAETWEYYSYIWYHTQLILNNTDHTPLERPIDWPYAETFAMQLGLQSNAGSASLLLEWLVKGLQILNFDGGPQLGTSGWHRQIANINLLVYPGFNQIWSEYSPSQRASMTQAYLEQWFATVQTFTPQQWYTGGWASPTEAITGSFNGDFGNDLYADLPQFGYFGVSTTLIAQIANWAQTVWPTGNWNVATTATCSSTNGKVVCSNYLY